MALRRRAPRIAAAVLVAATAASAQEAAETETAGPDPAFAGTLWVLETLNGAAFEARARLVFGEDEAGAPLIRGEGPCNSFRGIYGVETPKGGMFDAGPFAMTRLACANLDAETLFIQTLEDATSARLEDGRLILSGAGETRLVFTAEGPAPLRPGEGADDAED